MWQSGIVGVLNLRRLIFDASSKTNRAITTMKFYNCHLISCQRISDRQDVRFHMASQCHYLVSAKKKEERKKSYFVV